MAMLKMIKSELEYNIIQETNTTIPMGGEFKNIRLFKKMKIECINKEYKHIYIAIYKNRCWPVFENFLVNHLERAELSKEADK